MRSFRGGLALATLVTLFTVTASAQTAEMTGRITDATGAVIPGAQIEIRNIDTGVVLPVESNETGYYSAPLLPPGSYQITVKRQGFRPMTRSGIRLEVQQVARVDFTLEVGDVAEAIEVTGSAPLVSTEEASLATTVDHQKINQLPLNGRNPFSLVTLVPGVTSERAGSFGRRANINGARENSTEVLIDGGSTTTTDQGDLRVNPPLEGVEEFKVQTASFSPEFGHASGVISVVTRSGTNRLHGSLFEFVRNDKFDASNFFFNATGRSKPVLRYNQFGGAVGGPVWLPKIYDGRNRTFFFFTAEYTRQVGQGLNQTTVPSALERTGDFSRSGPNGTPVPIFDPFTTRPSGNTFTRDIFPNSMIPRARFNPIGLALLEAAYPLPNAPGVANNFVAAGGTVSNNDVYLMRGDHNFTPTNRLSVRYLRTKNVSQNPQAYPGFPGQGGANAAANLQNDGVVDSAVLRHTSGLRPNLLNEFVYGLLYNTSQLTPASANQGWAQQIGIKNAAPYLFPTVNLAGYSGVFGGNLSTEGDVDHQFADNVTWIKGSHSIKGGFEFRRLYFRNQQPGGNTAGNFTFNTLSTRNPSLTGAAAGGHSVAALLLGVPTSAAIAINDQKWGGFWHYYGWYLQDTWKVGPKLSLTYGVRYEYTRPRTEKHNRQSVFDLETQQLRFSGESGAPETLFEGDFNNLAPRIGLAYAPFGDQKTSIRAAWGIFHLPVHTLGALAGQFGKGFTAARTFQTTDGGITFPLTLSEAFPVVPVERTLVPQDSVATIGPEYPAPYVSQWTLSIQREMLRNTLFEVTYVGQKGTRLPISGRELNQVPAELLGPGNAQLRRPYPNLNSVSYPYQPVGNSIYHAIQVKAERRFAAGLNLLGWYSFGKSIDDSSGIFAFRTIGTLSVQNHYNLRAERSISTFDRSQTAVITGVYELPFGRGKRFAADNRVLSAIVGGWQVNGIATFRSGVPLSMGTSQNLTGSLGGGSRPNRLRSGKLPESERTIARWFDVSAYVPPPQFQFGNTSRTEPDVRGPGTAQVDFSLFRNIRFAEEVNFQIRAEAFNALNRVNFSDPNTSIGSPGAGIITAAGDARIIQLGARFTF
jgi:hypothetical protein